MSVPSSPVISTEQRAWQYRFADGLPTLVAGAGSLLAATSFTYDRSDQATLLTITTCFVTLLLYMSVLLFPSQIIEWLKSKITYPRTGYAQAPDLGEGTSRSVDVLGLTKQSAAGERAAELERLHEYRRQRVLLTCAAVGVAGFAMMYIKNRWIVGLAGVVMALGLWIWGRKVYRLSWVVVGGFPFMGFCLGLAIGERVHGPDRFTYFLFGAGTLLMLDGVLTLFRYLRANPRPTSGQA